LAAKEALEDRAMAVMFDNETITSAEVQNAVEIAKEIGIHLRIEKINVLEIEEIISNPVDRCGECKHHLMSILLDMAGSLHFDIVADGANADDPGDFRPGLAASDRLGIHHPLMECGIGKKEAREILERKGISVHNKPSTTCLMTRIPYGEQVSKEKLELIGGIEERVRSFGFKDIRLRLYERKEGGYIGILEVDEPKRAFDQWDSICRENEDVKLVLDPKGYRQGSLNEGLVSP
jgi:uncharacterized protein